MHRWIIPIKGATLDMDIKVALLAETLSPDSGWGRYAVELVTRLPDFGIQPVVLAPPQEKCAYPYNAITRRPSHSLALPFWLAGSYLMSCPTVRECDLVHAVVEHYAPIAAVLAGNRPFLFNIYGTYAVCTLKGRWFGLLMHWAIRRASRIVSISDYTAQRLQALVPTARTCVVRSGVDTSKFRPGRVWNADKGRMILSVGAIKPRKGHDILLSAFSRVAAEFPDATWVIVGSMSQKSRFVNQLQNEVVRLGLSSRVIFKGMVSQQELVELYQTCYFFALAPRNVGDSFEGYPLVYGEANACEKPIIATRDNGSEETVEDGVNGLLVNQNDVMDTERALRWLLAHSKEAVQMGMRGRQMVEQLTWTRTVEGFVECYKEVLGQRC